MQHDRNIMAEIKYMEIYSKDKNYHSWRDKPISSVAWHVWVIATIKAFFEETKPAANSS